MISLKMKIQDATHPLSTLTLLSFVLTYRSLPLETNVYINSLGVCFISSYMSGLPPLDKSVRAAARLLIITRQAPTPLTTVGPLTSHLA